MIKGMFGGALMVALLAGGAFVWGKLGGHHGGMGYGYPGGMSMSQGMDHGDMPGADHGDNMQPTHDMDQTADHDHGDSDGVTLAQAMETTSAGSDDHNHDDHAHTDGMDHDISTMGDGGLPSEPGQGAFAAVSEIVQMLIADPETDWTKVDITGLRNHLVDMDMLITNAEVTAVNIDGGLEMTVKLTGLGGGAASRMVPAHAPVLAGETGWDSTVEVTDTQVVWRVVSPENVDQIRALGFFGLMAMGDHHRAHHIGMARGAMVH